MIRRAAHHIESLVLRNVTQPWRSHRHFEEYYLGRLLQALDVDCVLDVGANIGQYGILLREYSHYKGRIISFEPTPQARSRLIQASANDPLWNIREFALGNFTGRSTFRTMPAFSVGNSFLPLRQEDQPEIAEIEVEVKRLSDVLPALQNEYGFSRPFLKMDTQGFDLEVFLGGEAVLDTIMGLQSELSVEAFYEGAPNWLEALNTYQKAGFALSTFVSNNVDWFPRMREVDCIMYRPAKILNQSA